MTEPAVWVWDDVLADVAAYRAAALAQPFESLTFGSKTFHGIAPSPDAQLVEWLSTRGFEDYMLTFLRKSPVGQVEPHYIHDDTDMGAWTAILYLTARPADGDGTIFWKHRDGSFLDNGTVRAWDDLAQWEPWRTVVARENRLVWFPSRCFHSRALPENYGLDGDARLIQVVFGGTPGR